MSSLIARTSAHISGAIGTLVLLSVSLLVAAGGTLLIALYLTEHWQDSPAMVELQCRIGLDRPDCPERNAEMTRLRAELEAMIAEKDRMDAQLAGLRAVETAIDEITLFETHDDPNSNLDVTVGTIYSRFVEARPSPDAHFCYIGLGHGTAGESRNLYFQGVAGPVRISEAKLARAGVSAASYEFARSVCRPFLIGRD